MRKVALAGVLVLVGCGHREVGRLDLTDEGMKTAPTTIHRGHVEVWTELDVDSSDNFRALYELKLTDGTNDWTQHCDPFDPSTTILPKQSFHDGSLRVCFTGKLRCSFDVPDGKYTAEAKLILSSRPASLEIHHMDVVFKQ